MLFNEHKIEYLLIQPSTEWAGTLKAAVVASRGLSLVQPKNAELVEFKGKKNPKTK